MDIVFIGAGRLATNLGRALSAAGHNIVQVYSRTMESAKAAAATMGGTPTNDLTAISPKADAYICAVADAALAQILPTACKGKADKVWMHTAGSMPIDVFGGMAKHHGVLYPMQTFSKDTVADFSHIPCFIEANDEQARQAITTLATGVSDNVATLSSADRKHLHLAAVFACNFANHCYTLAADIMQRHGMDFSALLPLIDETTRKVHLIDPAKAQTGPAVRYDENVIAAQSQLLCDQPLAKKIYELMSLSIHDKATEQR